MCWALCICISVLLLLTSKPSNGLPSNDFNGTVKSTTPSTGGPSLVKNVKDGLFGAKEVCYEGFACFETGGIWFHPLLRPLPPPEDPKHINTSFHLYDESRNISNYTIISWPNLENLNTSLFDANKTIYVLTHGFGSSGNADWVQNSCKKLNKYGQVVVVQWEIGAGRNYLQAASNARTVGVEISRLLRAINGSGISLRKNVHLLGSSLGAQASGYAGKNLSDLGLKRITGFDPAQPGFEGLDEKVHLTKGDAELVDAIHTSARPFIPFLGFGMTSAVSDVDFFVNGGAYQPGCLDVKQQIKDTGLNITSLADLANVATATLLKIVLCSHTRATAYFNEALTSEECHFWAKPKAIQEAYGKAGKKVGGVVSNVDKAVPGPLKNFAKPLAHQGVVHADTVVNTISEILPDKKNCTVERCTVVGLNTFEFVARGVFFVKTKDRSPFCVFDSVNEKNLGKYLKS